MLSASQPVLVTTQWAWRHRHRFTPHQALAASAASPSTARFPRSGRFGARNSSPATTAQYAAAGIPVLGRTLSARRLSTVSAGRSGGDQPNSALRSAACPLASGCVVVIAFTSHSPPWLGRDRLLQRLPQGGHARHAVQAAVLGPVHPAG